MANRNAQKFGQAAAQRRLLGQKDPRGPVGMFGRGKNIYAGGSTAAHSGGGYQFGRPKGSRDSYKRAAQRRVRSHGAYGR